MPAFARTIGIDYSGAQTPTASLKGLRVYTAEGDVGPAEVPPPPSPRRYWTRRGIAEWLVDRLAEDAPTLAGIDHGFSFPLRYFEVHGLKPDWTAFLDDFQRHWPTDDDHAYVDFVREGVMGNGAARAGNARWRRLTEERAGGAKSVFHFDVQGSVAKSTHAGIPWLRFIRQQLGAHVHFWPFDGWDIPAGRSAVALDPVIQAIRGYVLSAERIHADDKDRRRIAGVRLAIAAAHGPSAHRLCAHEPPVRPCWSGTGHPLSSRVHQPPDPNRRSAIFGAGPEQFRDQFIVTGTFIGNYYQVGVEAIIPANHASGTGIGAIGQLHLYLDDIFPRGIGRPLLGNVTAPGRPPFGN